MASLINHKSEITALQADLTKFCLQLQPQKQHASETTNLGDDDASEVIGFLEAQKQRVKMVEEDLLEVTDWILPYNNDDDDASDDEQQHPPPPRWTMSELSRGFRELQTLYTQQCTRLQSYLELSTTANETTTTTSEPVDSAQHQGPSDWMSSSSLSSSLPPWKSAGIGTSLYVVPETDNETDGSTTTTTPKSAMTSRYASSTTTTPSSSTATPCTPNLSVSTQQILQSLTPNDNDYQQQQQTLLGSIQPNHHPSPPTSAQKRTKEFLALETKLLQEVHGAARQFQSSPVDTHHHQSSSSSSWTYNDPDDTVTAGRQQEERQRITNHTLLVVDQEQDDYEADYEEAEVDDDDEDDYEDDSALYCATVKADERFKQQQSINVLSPHFQHPAHIEIHAAASPAPTNITMDFTAFADDEDEDDRSQESDETPVLDRYRLDADGTSPHGIRVVPNQRGLGKKKKKQSSSSVWPLSSSSSSTTAQSKSIGVQFASPAPSTSSATTTSSRRVFRKTPHPAAASKKRHVPSTPTIDENAPLNLAEEKLLSPTLDFKTSLVPHRSPLKSVSRPKTSPNSSSFVSHGPQQHQPDHRKQSPLESHSSVLTNQLDTYAPTTMNTTGPRSLAPSLVYAQAVALERPRPDTQRRVTLPPLRPRAPVLSTSSSSSSMPNTNLSFGQNRSSINNNNNNNVWITPISELEYEEAPQVVKMQVSLKEVEAATKLLNAVLLTTTFAAEEEMREDELKKILRDLPLDDRKIRSILLSLCHWRRLIMRRSGGKGDTLVFSLGKPY